VAKLVLNPTSTNRREIPLARSTVLTIGRDPSNDLVLPDSMVSRRHAVVEHRGGLFVLRDCSSANGSVVNGDRVSERSLRDGDLVAIGSMRLLFRDELVEATGGGKILTHPSSAPLRCPSCGGEYRRGDLFCRECGTQVGQPSGPPRAVCASCGTAVAAPAKYCPACGAPLPEAPAPAGPPPPSHRASGSMAMAPEPRLSPLTEPAPPPEAPPRPPGQRPAEPPAARAGRAAAREAAEPIGRLAAFVVDAVFVASGQAVLLAPVVWYWWAREAPRAPGEVAFLPVLASVTLVPLALLLGALYHVYFWSVKGATPGKELLDLRVETEDGLSPLPVDRASLRALGYVLGAASLGLGFAPVAFGQAALHDRIAATRVVKGGSR
jgi:uncharacterized RDD family membrane protein YckC